MNHVDATRRGLLKAAALLPLAGIGRARAQPLPAQPGGAATAATLAVRAGAYGHAVSESLASLSYETGQLADPTFFSPDNRSLIELFRRLNPKGVLRIGGNTSDFTVWSEYRGALPVQTPRKGGPQQPVVLRPEALHALAGFLRATGWSLVFGVNLKIGVPDMAVALAQAVRDAVGERLLAIQVGNEANNYEKNYEAFDRAWTPYARALKAAGLPLAGPDTGANTDWVSEYVRRHGRDNVFASRHYYRDAAPRGSIGDVLGSDPGMVEHMEVLASDANAQGLPLRLTEANTYYFGGRDGVSNVFASALWAADFMLAMAQCGVAGIHFHGGTLASVEASLGREAKADLSEADLAARRDAVSSRYSAIAGDVALGFQPRPLFHGIELAQQFGGARLLDARLDTGGANLAAYVAERGQEWLLALINKDAAADAMVAVSGLDNCTVGRIERLRAPSLDSRRGIEFGASTAREGEVAVDASGQARINVPRSSAALVRLVRKV